MLGRNSRFEIVDFNADPIDVFFRNKVGLCHDIAIYLCVFRLCCGLVVTNSSMSSVSCP